MKKKPMKKALGGIIPMAIRAMKKADKKTSGEGPSGITGPGNPTKMKKGGRAKGKK